MAAYVSVYVRVCMYVCMYLRKTRERLYYTQTQPQPHTQTSKAKKKPAKTQRHSRQQSVKGGGHQRRGGPVCKRKHYTAHYITFSLVDQGGGGGVLYFGFVDFWDLGLSGTQGGKVCFF